MTKSIYLTTVFLINLILPLNLAQVRIPIENENWKQFTPIHNKIYSIAVDGDTVWAGSDVGFFKVNINTGESVNYNRINSPLTDNWVIGIIVDSKHNKWIGTQEKGLIKVNGDDWKIFDQEYFGLFGFNIRSMTIDNDTLWISTWGDGLIKFNIINNSYKIYTTENSGLLYDAVYNLSIDKNGKKWIATMLGICSMQNEVWEKITDEAEDRGEGIVSLSVDKTGNVWVLNNKPAILKFEYEDWKEFEIPLHLFENGFCHAEIIHAKSEDIILVGTLDGLIEYRNGSWSKLSLDDDNKRSESVDAILYDNQDRLWIGGWDGLFCYNGIEWKKYPTGNSLIADCLIHSIEVDKENVVWITSTEGLTSYKDGKWKLYNKSNSGFTRNYLADLVVDSLNNKWIAQSDKGLAMFNDKENVWKFYDTINSPLPDNHIICLVVDKKGLLWVGTRKGLSSFDGVNWKTYSKENSNIPKSWVLKLAVDVMNNLWFISSEFDLRNREDKIICFNGKDFSEIDLDKAYTQLVNKSFHGLWIDNQDRKWITNCNELYWYENEHWNIMNKNATQIFYSCIGEVKNDGIDIVISSTMGGLIRYNGKKFMASNEKNSFIPNNISCFNIDAYGNKWIGTETKGIILYNPKGIQYGNATIK